MTTMLGSLLSARPRKSRGEASAARARSLRSRPLIEPLDDRCLLSVSAAFNPIDGVLNIATDQNYNTKAKIAVSQGRVVVSDDFQGNLATSPTVSQVKKIVFTSNTVPLKQVTLTNLTSIDTDIYTNSSSGSFGGGGGVNRYFAGPGASYCNGGSGTNLFYDSPASANDFNVGTGDNVLFLTPEGQAKANGVVPCLQNPFNVSAKSKSVVWPDGVTSDPYANPGNLANSGSSTGITVSLDSANGALSLRGPTGGGFRIRGNWTDVGSNTSGHAFKATGNLYLETGLIINGGRLSLPIASGSQGITVSTKPSILSTIGEFSTLAWAGTMPLSSSGSDSSSLSDFGSKFGMDFQTAGASWGIKLGADLAKTTGLPLLGAVPYFYATSSTGVSVSFNDNVSAGTTDTGFALAFDPADPAVFAKFTASMGTVAVAASLRGAIPYRPDATPDNLSTPSIFGNIYTSAADVALADLPFTVSGATIIDLDANNDGVLAGLDKSSIKALLKGQLKVGDQLSSSIRDIAIGFNGGLAASTGAYGFNLSAKLAKGSAFYTVDSLTGAQTMAFRVSTVNPFAGTKLESLSPTSTVDLSGYLQRRSSGNLDWGFSADASTCNLMAMSGSTLSLEADSQSNTARVSLGFKALLGLAGVEVTGKVNLSNGDFDLSQTAYVSMDLKIATVQMREEIHFTKSGSVFTAYALMDGSFRIGDSTNNIYGRVRGTVYITMASGVFDFWGDGTATVGITVLGISEDASLGFSFSTHGFGVKILGKTIRASW